MKPITFFLLLKLAIIFLCSCLNGFSQTTNSLFFQFVQEQSERHYTQVPHEVLAFYYGWFMSGSWKSTNSATHEIGSTVRYPSKSLYDSHDPKVIDLQIDEAEAHGITCFVLSWFGTGPDAAQHEVSMQLLMERAEKKDFKVSINWEQAPGKGRHQVERAIFELSYALKRYGRSKAFLKVDGKPVIFAYDRVSRQLPMMNWPDVIHGARAEAGDFVLIGDSYRSQMHVAWLFDGVTSFDYEGVPGHLKADPGKNLKEFREWAEMKYTEFARIDRTRSRITCLSMIPGFDNTKSSPARLKTDRAEGQTYSVLWEAALKAKPDWILVYSWNEWGEGTEIEPSIELGDKYLQITAKYAKPFLDSPTVSVSAPALPPRFLPGTEVPAVNLLAGRTIGIMDPAGRFSDPEFWALYCGANVRQLTWEDLIDPAKFNARELPLLIHVAATGYPGSVKTSGDVKKALVGFLRDGGFLVSLPFDTWPLLYDTSQGGKPIALTDDLRLGVNSWAGFPAPTELKFSINTNLLHGLPTAVAFPTTGDLRWTGASRSRVPQYDNYVPLVQLRDTQNRYFGEGAVYIEHKTLPLSPGKTIYVWMRMPELLGENEFYQSLYQFISTKLKSLQPDK